PPADDDARRRLLADLHGGRGAGAGGGRPLRGPPPRRAEARPPRRPPRPRLRSRLRPPRRHLRPPRRRRLPPRHPPPPRGPQVLPRQRPRRHPAPLQVPLQIPPPRRRRLLLPRGRRGGAGGAPPRGRRLRRAQGGAGGAAHLLDGLRRLPPPPRVRPAVRGLPPHLPLLPPVVPRRRGAPSSAAQEAQGGEDARRDAAPAPKKHKAEKTLAEMQLQLAKRKGKDQRAAQSSSSGDSDEPSELEVPEEEPDSYHSGQMAVEDSDFYNFDADRMEKCFKRGQVWALYGDDDGMPRHYALVETASPGRQFRAQIRWLEHQPDGKEGKPCGAFKVGREVTVHSVNVFSHLVACERVAREAYRVYPKKGSVWALHAGEYADTGRPKYDFVVFLSGYSEVHGISFGYLEKVEGFRSIFARREIGVRAVQYLREGDVGLLSHQTPARKVSKGEASTLPRGDCWELDPASLPAELLHA
uniref:DUF3444 domain-containing protein n=1 Tax=Aegilops tauschii subsp. strangulata TaxID=200361 RepID=A0A453QDZ1_AEGTS